MQTFTWEKTGQPDSSALVDDGEAQGEEVGQDTQHVDDVHAGFHEPEKSNPKTCSALGLRWWREAT